MQLSIVFFPTPSPFLSPPLLLPNVLVDTAEPPNKASIKTSIAILTAVNIDTIVILKKGPYSLSISVYQDVYTGGIMHFLRSY